MFTPSTKRIAVLVACCLIVLGLIAWSDDAYSISRDALAVIGVLGIAAVLGTPLVISIYGFWALSVALILLGLIAVGCIQWRTQRGKLLFFTGISLWCAMGVFGLGHAG